MEDKLKDNLNEILEAVKKGGEFATDQAPAFLQEYLTYYTALHGVSAFLAVAWFIAALYVAFKFRERFKEEDPDEYNMVGIGIGLINGLLSLVVFIHHILHLLKITLASRLYIVEHLTEIL